MEAPFLEKIVAHPTTDPHALALRLTAENGVDTILAVRNDQLGEFVHVLCNYSAHLPAIVESAEFIPPALIAHYIGVDAGRSTEEVALTICVGGLQMDFVVPLRDLFEGLKSLLALGGRPEGRPN